MTNSSHAARVDLFPTSISDLHFSSNNQNFSSTLASLKRSALSTHNRLCSIQHDSLFVQSVASRHGLPLIANERCGSWYIPPKKKIESAYFKSTDGHFGVWAFSLRRLNLQILGTIGAAGGCVIVDSTRRGKSMPDALSKTVPIWCTVLNRSLFPERLETHHLQTPAEAVGPSEHAQIEARLQGFVTDFESLQLNTRALRETIKKPLIASWITPDSEDMTSFDDKGFKRVICCTASHRVGGHEASENGYIQGAADDHEAWSQGLTPSLFWTHRDKLLHIPEADVGDFVRSCHSTSELDCKTTNCATEIGTTGIHIASITDSVRIKDYDGLIRITNDATLPLESNPEKPAKGPSIFQIQCKPGKLGSRALRTHLSSIMAFLGPLFSSPKTPSILIMCHDGKDLSVGVALAALCLFYDDKGNLKPVVSRETINKTMIRRRLARITSAKPEANPSRATLQSVHAFLMP